MASFDRAIPPGGEGKVTLKVKTKGYQGTIRKSARVKSNDPKNSNLILVVKATVEVPVFVSRRYVHIQGQGDKAVHRDVLIRAELNKPLSLTPVEFTLDKKVTYVLETIKKDKEYRIRFTSVPGVKENYRGLLKLKTNYSEQPEITISIYGRFRHVKPAPRPVNPFLDSSGSPRPAGTGEAPILVSSRYVRLLGKPGVEISRSVEVAAKLKKPLTLQTDRFTLEGKLTYRIESVEKDRKYKILFKTLPNTSQNFNGILRLKTNYEEMPVITFVIHGRFAAHEKGNNG